MTNFPDSESLKVCPGHIPENFVPKHGCSIQLTTDTGLSTAEGEALPLADQLTSRERSRTGLEAPVHQGKEACLVSVDTPPLYRVSGLVLKLSSPAQLPYPHPPISHSFKTSLLCLETNRMAKKTPPPHPWDWAGNVGQAWGRGFSLLFPWSSCGAAAPFSLTRSACELITCGPGCPSQNREPRLESIPSPGAAGATSQTCLFVSPVSDLN